MLARHWDARPAPAALTEATGVPLQPSGASKAPHPGHGTLRGAHHSGTSPSPGLDGLPIAGMPGAPHGVAPGTRMSSRYRDVSMPLSLQTTSSRSGIPSQYWNAPCHSLLGQGFLLVLGCPHAINPRSGMSSQYWDASMLIPPPRIGISSKYWDGPPCIIPPYHDSTRTGIFSQDTSVTGEGMEPRHSWSHLLQPRMSVQEGALDCLLTPVAREVVECPKITKLNIWRCSQTTASVPLKCIYRK